MSLADELLKLQQLRDSGTLTDEEFELAKDRLLRPEQPAAGASAPLVAPVVQDFNILKQVDPAVTRVADKAVNFQGVAVVIFFLVFLVVASIIAFTACSMISPG